jgi:zinc protease
MKTAVWMMALVSGVASAAEVALPPDHGPAVTVSLQFQTGAIDDPPGKAGITYLATRVMAEGGTEKLDAKQLNEALFPLATAVRARVDEEVTTFTIKAHRDHVDKVIGILGDVVTHPRWDPAEFARLRDAAVNDVEKRLRQGDDENLGKEALAELMFRGHPYGHLILGHVRDLRSISLDELRAHAQKVFTRDRLTIGLAGGYSPEVANKLRAVTASLPASGAPQVKVPNAVPRGPRVRIVEKDSSATAVSIGVPWKLSRHDPDFAAWLVARSAFGEHRQFNGRLMQRLREARGLNYGDYAYIEHFVQEGGDAVTAQTGRARHQGEFTIWLRPVQNENALFAARAALYELEHSYTDEPFSDAEVARTKGFLDGYVLLYAQTAARRLGYALDDKALDPTCDMKFLENLRRDLGKVSTTDVNRVWSRMKDLQPRLQIVLVGPKAQDLKKLILSRAPTPIHYQKDAEGHSPERPKAQLEIDAQIAKLPWGAKGDADVEIVPVSQMFE